MELKHHFDLVEKRGKTAVGRNEQADLEIKKKKTGITKREATDLEEKYSHKNKA